MSIKKPGAYLRVENERGERLNVGKRYREYLKLAFPKEHYKSIIKEYGSHI